MLNARHYFLTGVAALVEDDPVGEFVVDRLRNEAVGGRGEDRADARGGFGRPPVRVIFGGGEGVRILREDEIADADVRDARKGRSVGDAHDRKVGRNRGFVLGGEFRASGGKTVLEERFGFFAEPREQRAVFVRGKVDVGAQYVHADALQKRGFDRLGEKKRDRVPFAQTRIVARRRPLGEQ